MSSFVNYLTKLTLLNHSLFPPQGVYFIFHKISPFREYFLIVQG